jgi:hypothetical protein
MREQLESFCLSERFTISKSQFPSPSPVLAIGRHNLHLPIPFSIWGTDLPDPPAPTWPRHDPVYRHGEPRKPRAFPMYPQRCGASGPSPSCRHRTRRSPLFRRLHALAIDNCGARTLPAALPTSHSVSETVVDFFQGPIVAPLLEVHIDGRIRREVTREHAPSAATAQNVEDGIDYCTKVRLSRPPSRLGGWEEARNDTPFHVGKVARVAHARLLARLSGLPKHPLR